MDRDQVKEDLDAFAVMARLGGWELVKVNEDDVHCIDYFFKKSGMVSYLLRVYTSGVFEGARLRCRFTDISQWVDVVMDSDYRKVLEKASVYI